MGNIFVIKESVFCGHAVENSFCYWGAVVLGQSSAPERKVVESVVSSFRRQPQDRLQVESSFFARWASRVERSFPQTASDAAALGKQMAPANWFDAQEAFRLGAEKS